jgi:hypothetical protein
MNESSEKTSNRHWSLKEKVKNLRSQGLSYNEILKEVKASKSSVSLWCRDVPLTKAQKKRLHEKRPQAKNGIAAIQRYFWKKRCAAFDEGRVLTRRFYNDPIFIGGLMLYWAEGSKAGGGAEIANSDNRLIRFMVHWFDVFFGRPPESLRIHMHLHSGQNEEDMKKYWSKITGVPLANFQKSFIKPEGSGYRKNVLYNGTIKLRVRGGSTYALYTILGCIAEYLDMAIQHKSSVEHWTKKLPFEDVRP